MAKTEIKHDVAPRTLFVRVRHDETNVRYVLSVVDRDGTDYPNLLDRDERGTFDTGREAETVARWLAERLRKMGHSATILG